MIDDAYAVDALLRFMRHGVVELRQLKSGPGPMTVLEFLIRRPDLPPWANSCVIEKGAPERAIREALTNLLLSTKEPT